MIDFQNISKSFAGVEVLHQISFSIERGTIIALVGENGAGKSTLMKILSGILTDYEGKMLLEGKPVQFANPKQAEMAGISIIHQELNLIPDLSVAENIFLDREPVLNLGLINFKKMHRETETFLKDFDFPYPPHIKVRNLSIGWQQMVEIARTLSLDARVVIMDEPTSALSDSEIKLLFEKIRLLKQKGKTVIYISHRMNEISEIADWIAVLRDGHFMGKFASSEMSREKLIQLMIGREGLEENTTDITKHRDREILKLDKLSVFEGRTKILSDISFTLKEGEVLGVAGLLGAGRTELLKFLYGEKGGNYIGTLQVRDKPYYPHSANHALKHRIAYLSEDRKSEGIFADLDILKNGSISVLKALSRVGFIKSKTEKNVVSAQLTKLNTRMKSLHQKIITLSGGNQQKVLLSRILLIEPEILLLDEPTRGIDVGAKQEIYELVKALSDSGMAIIVTSSEIPELFNMCHHILVLSQGIQSALLPARQTNSQQILSYAFKMH